MTKARVPETYVGIQGESIVADYDEMQRSLRDRGWIETKALLDHGLTQGSALELGHGPGYLGLEWLKHTQNTQLAGLDISPDMHALAQRNAQEYGLSARTQYHLGSGDHMPFDEAAFDAVFTNGSLHEWANPTGTFDELWRVLKPGGRFFISDLRRDMNWMVRGFLWARAQPVAMRPGLISSINAAYTPDELRQMLAGTRLAGHYQIESNLIDISISGVKPNHQTD